VVGIIINLQFNRIDNQLNWTDEIDSNDLNMGFTIVYLLDSLFDIIKIADVLLINNINM